MPEFALLNTDRTIRRTKDSPTCPPSLKKGDLQMVWLPVVREPVHWYENSAPPVEPVPSKAVEVRWRAVRKPDAELWAIVRARRDVMLAACDWTQVLDAPAKYDKALWAAYRQALRDIPQLNKDPVTAVWPKAPIAPV